MLQLILVLSILSYVTALPRLDASVCFENSKNMTAPEEVAFLMGSDSDANMDSNGDGRITESEMLLRLMHLTRADSISPVPLSFLANLNFATLNTVGNLINLHPSRDLFLNMWTAASGDSRPFSEAIFDAFDVDNDGRWDMSEIDGFRNDIFASADARTGGLSVAACKNYLDDLYVNRPTCPPSK